MVSSKLWAGIVVYYPDVHVLGALISSLGPQVEKIVVFNNGGLAPEDLHRLVSSVEHLVIDVGENVGIGEALNQISHAAAAEGVEYLVTFDQDSTPAAGFVDGLLNCLEALRRAGRSVAAVGPVFVDRREEVEVFPVFEATRSWVKRINPLEAPEKLVEASILITSGMIVDVRAWETIGEFRADFFIDHVDTEWCLRARSMGYSLGVCSGTVMEHRLSDAPPRRVLGRLVLNYSPLRRYYAFRNTCCLLKMPSVPRGMKNYLAATLAYRFFLNLIIDDQRLLSLKAMLTGIFHGFSGRMGRRW
jgi:rhamnosyltransferase